MQMNQFWSELPLHTRKELLRLDKQTLFEQARRNLYCSRCNGLLLEGFSQIITYGKSLQQEGASFRYFDSEGTCQSQNRNDHEVQDPSLHPWGGLTATKNGVLTVLDCFICARSLKTLQNVSKTCYYILFFSVLKHVILQLNAIFLLILICQLFRYP